MDMLLTVVTGIVVGVATGVFGAGGGIIAVPALVYVAGIPLPQAIATSLLVGALGPIAALLPRLRDGIDRPLVAALAAGGIPAAWLGTAAGSVLPDQALLLAFAALMIVAAARMLRGAPPISGETDRPSHWVLRAVAVGASVGFLTGLLGVGGGFLTVPALVIVLRVPIRSAIGTSLAVTVINAASGLVAHASSLQVDWALVLAFAVPALTAAVLGARLSGRLDAARLSRSFAVFVLVVALGTVLQVVATALAS